MFVYNYSTQNDVTPGIYYNDGTQWVRSIAPADIRQWFYLPSFNLDISSIEDNKTVDLYAVYKNQFTAAGNSKFMRSDAVATATDQPLYAPNQLTFVVTDYDATVIQVNSITTTSTGCNMSYNVLSTNAAPYSYINIVCIVK
jgi:hypothetical protein